MWRYELTSDGWLPRSFIFVGTRVSCSRSSKFRYLRVSLLAGRSRRRGDDTDRYGSIDPVGAIERLNENRGSLTMDRLTPRDAPLLVGTLALAAMVVPAEADLE